MTEKKEIWTSFVALSTAAMAVMAALTTLYMGKFSSRTILLQAQESDQWAYYQAKSIKSHTFDLQKQHTELELATMKGKLPKEVAALYQKAIDGYGENLKRYDGEKKEIKDKAEQLARDKQVAQARAGVFGYALIFLQIAIMLSSISALTKKRPLWYFGIATSIAGIFFFIDGFYMFY